MAFDLIIVGGGQMGSAVVGGLLAAGYDPSRLAIVEAAAGQRDVLAERFPVVALRAALELADVAEQTGVVLCVKPDQAEAAARQVAVAGATRLLSVVTGLATARLEAVFPVPVAVVRSMPNTPVLVRRGVTAIAGGAHCTKADLDWAEEILGSLGTVVRVAERHLDTVAGLSGAMPAYLYMVVESLIEAGVHQGLPRPVSRQLVIDTFAGAGALLVETGDEPENLRHAVTSPGGVTAAGLRMLEGRAVRAAFLEAVATAAERSRQLGR
jgi:pyrroline-5-carboxylate reductase